MLVQLPPSLAFDAPVAAHFFGSLAAIVGSAIVCEPRHPSWFGADAAALLAGHRVARVIADPAPVSAAAEPAGWPAVAYFCLHGSPEIYRSGYDAAVRAAWHAKAMAAGGERWVIFDNTAGRAATGDALAFRDLARTAARSAQAA